MSTIGFSRATTPHSTMPPQRPSWRGHLRIARLDHWIKNVFVLPGTVVALTMDSTVSRSALLTALPLGILAVGLVASSNYTLNEILDAPYDRCHPTKCQRPVPSGQVNVPLAYVQWIGLMVAALLMGYYISLNTCLFLSILWAMGCVYNVPPIRTKEVPYLDVLSEAINNPLRMLIGWSLTGTHSMIPLTLLMSYWMVGSYFMAIKRFAEYRDIGNIQISAAYRKSFAYYNEKRLLISINFYGAQAMLYYGAFLIRYRLELILSFPLVSLVMATYFALGFKSASAAENPEKLYREPLLMTAVITCTATMVFLLWYDIPALYRLFAPSLHR